MVIGEDDARIRGMIRTVWLDLALAQTRPRRKEVERPPEERKNAVLISK